MNSKNLGVIIKDLRSISDGVRATEFRDCCINLCSYIMQIKEEIPDVESLVDDSAFSAVSNYEIALDIIKSVAYSEEGNLRVRYGNRYQLRSYEKGKRLCYNVEDIYHPFAKWVCLLWEKGSEQCGLLPYCNELKGDSSCKGDFVERTFTIYVYYSIKKVKEEAKKKIPPSIISEFFPDDVPSVSNSYNETKKSKSFRDIISYQDKDSLLKRLHFLIDDNGGKIVGLVLLKAKKDGFLLKIPSEKEFASEFVLNGSWESIRKYTVEDSPSNLEYCKDIKIL